MQNRRNNERVLFARIPKKLHNVSIALINGTESEATVLDMSALGMKLAISESSNEFSSVIKKGDSLNIDFTEVSLHISGQCVHKDGISPCTLGVFISNPYHRDRYNECLNRMLPAGKKKKKSEESDSNQSNSLHRQ